MRHGDEARAGGRLFDAFPPASDAAWRAAAEAALDGGPFEQLITPTHEGIALQPIYTAESTADLPGRDTAPGAPPYRRGTTALGYVLQPWSVAQELPYPTAAETNAAARADLTRGLTTLHVPTDRATRAGLDPDRAPASSVGAGGLSLATADDAGALFDGIALAQTPLLIPAGAAGMPVAALIVAAAARRGAAAADVHGCVGGDPLGTLVAQGVLPIGLERAYDTLAWLTAWSARHAPRLRTVLVDVRPYHDGGASAVQDLAFALATGVEYLRALQDRGLAVAQVAPRMQFAFSVGGSFFMEVARLRAARVLWARVVAAFGADAAAGRLRLHARTSAWTKSRADAHTNMLRATTEAFAAVMGGCDSLHVSPHDEALGLPDEFSRRIARNVQFVLREESHFVRLVDPAGGSWYVESLTDQVAQQAWALFQEVERRGGLATALAQGFPQAGIATVRDARFAQIAERREAIVGVNQYACRDERWYMPRVVDGTALPAERVATLQRFRAAVDAASRAAALRELSRAAADAPHRVMERAITAAQSGATLGELFGATCAAKGVPAQVEAIAAHRGAERFEELREAMERHAERTGVRMAVFLATMGAVAQHKARADFATGFFRAGGFDVIERGGFDDAEVAARAARESGAAIVVICSTDESYRDLVPTFAARLKPGRKTTVVVAGHPAGRIDALRAAGAAEFIHPYVDCHATLARLQRAHGVGR